MYNQRVAIQGLMGLRNIELDLTGIKGSIIAIAGDNGAGKTTLLESIGFAGLYRTLPSREQGIHKYCDSESYIENDFIFNNNAYRTKIMVNAAGNRVEAYLFENGKVVNDGKASSFDEEIVKRFGSGELILSSVFSAQDSVGSFLKLPRPKRKDLFISMLNLGILQDISTYADDMVVRYSAKEKEVTIKIDSLSSACSVEIPDKNILEEKKKDIELYIAHKTQVKSELQDRLRELENEAINQRAIKGKIADLGTKIESLDCKRIGLERKIKLNKQELNKNIEVASASDIVQLEILADSLSMWEEKRAAAAIELQDIEQKEYDRQSELIKANEALSFVKNSLSNEERNLELCRKDSKMLGDVPCGGEGLYSTCPLLKDSIEQKKHIPESEDWVRRLRLNLSDAQAHVDYLDSFCFATAQLKDEIANIQCNVNTARNARLGLSSIQGKKNQNELISKLIGELEHNLGEVLRELSDTEAEVVSSLGGSLNEAVSDSEIKDNKKAILEMDSELEKRKQALHETIMELGKVDIIKDNVKSAEAITAKLNKELEAIREDKSEWAHIAYSFGPKAIQALEIDSAGPWVSEIINDLLRSCFGNRFSINLITQAMRANKSGMKDFFDIEVTDTEKNRTGLVNDLSGGEKVICSEAISLAIALYNGNVGGVKWDTLYRDECSGALSPKNAPLYIKMLRRAIELGKFKRCFFIAHQPELVDSADNQIILKDGNISIR